MQKAETSIYFTILAWKKEGITIVEASIIDWATHYYELRYIFSILMTFFLGPPA